MRRYPSKHPEPPIDPDDEPDEEREKRRQQGLDIEADRRFEDQRGEDKYYEA